MAPNVKNEPNGTVPNGAAEPSPMALKLMI